MMNISGIEIGACVVAAGVIGAALGRLVEWLPVHLELAWRKESAEVVATQASIAAPMGWASLVTMALIAASMTGLSLAFGSSAGVAVGALVFLLALLVLAAIDARTFLLPDVIVLPLVWLGLLANLDGSFVPLSVAVVGAVSGYMSFWCVAKLFALVTRREGMGHGDFKLLAAIGAWLGWAALPEVVVVAAVGGLAWALLTAALARLRGARTNLSEPMPFGPFLALGGAIAMVGKLLGSLHLW